ncbi:MAG: HD domain-containing protein [Spirochaetota bacterium]|nr:MAG: HD domain-containing protein [Spirochaetota bacterium]
MKELPLEDLKAGSVLESHVYYDDYFIVIPKYHSITEDDIRMVRSYNLSPLYSSADIPSISAEIEGIEETPKPEEVKVPPEHEEPQVVEPIVEEEVKSSYESIISSLSRIFEQIEGGERIRLENIRLIATHAIEYSQTRKEEALLRISRGMDDLRLEAHSLHAGILCMFLANGVNIIGSKLIDIVAGALMHDIGILLLNEDEKSRNLMKHTLYGYQYLKAIKDAPPFMVLPSLQHHEKSDGSGYPNKMLLKDIDTATKIVTICDSCDAQVSYIRYGNDLSVHMTKDELFSWKKEDFDPALFNQFTTTISSVFRMGRKVELSDDNIGKVKKTSLRFPLNPVIEIVADSIGVGLEKPVQIELMKSKDIFIKRFI